MKPVNMPKEALLGPAFETQTKDTFTEYVSGLKQLRSIGKVRKPKVPKVKKEVFFHVFDDETGRCGRCGKKVRSKAAKCPGAATGNQEKVTPVEKTLATETQLS